MNAEIKELLRLAAKAMGKELSFYMDTPRDTTGFHESMNILAAPVWNPLENAEQFDEMEAELGIDTKRSFGDVLRIRLQVGDLCVEDFVTMQLINQSSAPEVERHAEHLWRKLKKGLEHKTDEQRMAALRVAADIGRAM